MKIFRKDEYILGPIPLFFVFLALYFSSFLENGLWLDELFSWYFSDPNLSYYFLLENRMKVDVHPPLYYTALYFWGRLFGGSETSLRLFSLMPVLFSFLFIYFSGLRAFDKENKLALIMLCTTSYLLFKFSMEARSYEWMFFLSLISSFYLLEIISDSRNNHQQKFKNFMFFSVSTYFLCASHLIGFIFGGLLIIFFLIYMFLNENWLYLLAGFAFGIVCAATMAIWLFYSMDAFSSNTGGSHWIRLDMAPMEIVSFIAKLYSVNALLVLAVLYSVYRYRRDLLADHVFSVSLYILVAFLVLLTCISLHTPIIIDRFLIVTAPIFLFLTARSLSVIRSGTVPLLIAGTKRFFPVISLCLMIGVNALAQKSDWAETSEIVRSFPECAGQKILIFPAFDAGVISSPSTGDHAEVIVHEYYFPGDKPAFVNLTENNFHQAMQNACPIISWSAHTKDNPLHHLLKKTGYAGAEFRCISKYRAQVCFKPPN